MVSPLDQLLGLKGPTIIKLLRLHQLVPSLQMVRMHQSVRLLQLVQLLVLSDPSIPWDLTTQQSQ